MPILDEIARTLKPRATAVGLILNECDPPGHGEDLLYTLNDAGLDGAVVWQGTAQDCSLWLYGYTQGLLKMRLNIVSLPEKKDA